jgi:glyoxylase-like metal-dependent hydrolase (beta-lactamase superfamily II)
MSLSPPNLPWHPIPSSTATCKVYLMQAGGLYIPNDMTLLPGPDQPNDSVKDPNSSSSKTFYAPDYVFLIEHTPSGNKYIFDLGMRKDLENLPPLLKENVLPQFKCEPQSPADILIQHGNDTQQPKHIKAVIFSHMHFDHVGDGAKAGFHDAELWIGPTSCTYARPGYPINPRAPTLSDTLPVDGTRKIVEAYISDDMYRDAGDARAGKVNEGMAQGKYAGVDLKKPDWMGLGAFDRAYDVWGDGSAWLVDAPGHSSGHWGMLIRTTGPSSSSSSEKQSKDDGADGSTFIFLAGDAFHHPSILHDPRRTARPPYSKESMHAEPEVAMDTIWRVRRFAEREDVWVVGAHDFSVGEGIEGGKKVLEGLIEVNGWREKGWKKKLGEGNML